MIKPRPNYLRFLAGLFALVSALPGSSAVALTEAPGSDKQSDGIFTGIALITDDPSWHALFQRPETPHVRGQDHFEPGQRGVLAILFSNAEPRQGVVRVICDVTAFDPRGSQLVVDSGPCYEGPFLGPNILHPALLDLQFEIGRDDPEGRGGFEITLRDAHSDREVDLEVSFTQGAGE